MTYSGSSTFFLLLSPNNTGNIATIKVTDKSTGKGLYRIWISVRIPEFENKDIVEYEDKMIQVNDIGKNRVVGVDIKTNKKHNIPMKNLENNTCFFRICLDWINFGKFIEQKYQNVPKVNIINHACSIGEEAYSLAIIIEKF